jgi:hypothetical protein
VGVAATGTGQEPARLSGLAGQPLPYQPQPSINQRMADHIAQVLRQSGNLHNYSATVAYVDGIVELTGTVTDQPQHDEVIRMVQGVPGVTRVVDHLTITTSPVKQVQAGSGEGSGEKGSAVLPPPQESPQASPADDKIIEPRPLFQASQPSSMDMGNPGMPPYSWPTYAPYNNYSRVGYPLAYPYASWPFIGPIYPFPKIPPGWRSVKLEWEDGYWWFSRVGCKHDWWRLRFW